MDLLERNGDEGLRHPWETTRAHFFLDVLKRSGTLEGCRRLIDVGAGDGWTAASIRGHMRDDAEVVCWDTNYTAAHLDELAAVAPAGLTFTSARPGGSFGLLLLLDVMEHVEDDRGFLRGLVQDLIAPGGAALISVPAWMPLYSAHDEALLHHRRYSPSACRQVIDDAGLDITLEGGLFHSLLAPRGLSVALARLRSRLGLGGGPPPNLGEWSGGALVTGALNALLKAEARLSLELATRGVAAPGLSYWALTRKRR